MPGSGVQPTVVWGLVAHQMGFRRASDDLKHAAVNPDAGKQAAQWVMDLFDKRKVSTRDVADRYKAFGTGQGSIFWTGPWTLNGYVQQGLPFRTYLFPTIGEKRVTYFEMGGMELYKQRDKGRYEATMQAVKWLSDNSFLWTTVGRGASPRKSILDRPDDKTAGAPRSESITRATKRANVPAFATLAHRPSASEMCASRRAVTSVRTMSAL